MNMGIEEFIESHPDSKAVFGRENDLMFIVDDAKEWHENNAVINSEEYIKKGIISRFIDKHSRSESDISYGVVDFEDLFKYLVNWENIAVAERFLRDADFLHFPNKETNLGAYVLDTYLQHNRENAVLVNLLANETTSIKELLYKILSNNTESLKDTKAYVRDNYSSLVSLFELEYGNDYYTVDGDRVFLSYGLMKEYGQIILPKSLIKYYDEKDIELANRKKVLLATKEYLRQKEQKDKNILNDSFSDEFERSSVFTLK